MEDERLRRQKSSEAPVTVVVHSKDGEKHIAPVRLNEDLRKVRSPLGYEEPGISRFNRSANKRDRNSPRTGPQTFTENAGLMITNDNVLEFPSDHEIPE